MNYDDIIDLLATYSDREDVEVLDRLDKFLRIAEIRIGRLLNVGKMVALSSITLLEGQEYYTLPPDFSGLRSIKMVGGGTNTTLHMLSPEQMVSVGNLTTAGIYYNIIGQRIQISPIQSLAELEIAYYRLIPPLTVANPQNWVSVYASDAYIFGGMVEVSSFVKNADAAKLWDDRFLDAISSIEDADSRARWSGTPLQIRTG